MVKTLQIDLPRLRGLIPHGKRKEIAQEVGMHRYTLWKKLYGKTEFTISEASRLAEALGIDVDEFIKIQIGRIYEESEEFRKNLADALADGIARKTRENAS